MLDVVSPPHPSLTSFRVGMLSRSIAQSWSAYPWSPKFWSDGSCSPAASSSRRTERQGGGDRVVVEAAGAQPHGGRVRLGKLLDRVIAIHRGRAYEQRAASS